MLEKNYNDKFFEVKKLFGIWLQRSITPLGRVAVLKSLILSKLIHLWILLPDPPPQFIDKLQKECFKFVWNGKQDRITRATAIRSVKTGGLNIPDLKTYMASLKLIWIKKLKISNHKWKNVCTEMFPFLNNMEKFGSEYPHLHGNSNKFWAQVFEAYSQFGNNITVETLSQFLSEPVFYNNNIQNGGRFISFKRWIRKGVYCISHFLDENGSFLSVREFNTRHDMNVDFLTLAGVVSAIRCYLRKLNITVDRNDHDVDTPLFLDKLYTSKNGSKDYYMVLLHSKLPNCCAKWEAKTGLDIPWDRVFYENHKIQDVKLKWFQIRILHRILATNIMLNKMDIVNSQLCNFCYADRDSIEHMFWHCNKSQSFWNSLALLINQKCAHASNISFSLSLVLFGVDPNQRTDTVFNLILLLAKSFLYNCKRNNTEPAINAFINTVQYRYKIEKFNATMSNDMHVFHQNWIYYQALLL
jgi:hypothetical protein